MDKEQIIGQLILIRDKKEKAITEQLYEMALELRAKEIELMVQLDEFDKYDQSGSS